MSQLTDEVRQPSKRLTIADVTSEIVFTDEQGQVRRFHPTGQAKLIPMGEIPVTVTAGRSAAQLHRGVQAERGRQLRYVYSRTANPDQLVVDVELVGKGGGDKVRHVYKNRRRPHRRRRLARRRPEPRPHIRATSSRT